MRDSNSTFNPAPFLNIIKGMAPSYGKSSDDSSSIPTEGVLVVVGIGALILLCFAAEKCKSYMSRNEPNQHALLAQGLRNNGYGTDGTAAAADISPNRGPTMVSPA